MRLRCIYGKDDEFHRWTEQFLTEITWAQLAQPLRLRKSFDKFFSGIIHRDGPYQVELIYTVSELFIPEHTHPNAESIEWPVSGVVRFNIDGRDLFPRMSDEHAFDRWKCMALRIGKGQKHGGRVTEGGALFLSIQCWDTPHDFIAHNWDGELISSNQLT